MKVTTMALLIYEGYVFYMIIKAIIEERITKTYGRSLICLHLFRFFSAKTCLFMFFSGWFEKSNIWSILGIWQCQRHYLLTSCWVHCHKHKNRVARPMPHVDHWILNMWMYFNQNCIHWLILFIVHSGISLFLDWNRTYLMYM